MIRDHNAVIEQAVELVSVLGVTPMGNDLSSQMKEDAGDTKEMLLDKTAVLLMKRILKMKLPTTKRLSVLFVMC